MQAPRLPSMIRNVRMKPKGFKYTPRYYDPEKEALEKRIRIIEKEVEIENRDGAIAKARMESRIRHSWDARPGSARDKGRGMRLAIIIGLLLTLARVVYGYL